MAQPTYELTAHALAMLPARVRNRSKMYAGFTLEWNPLAAMGGAVAAARQPARFTIPADVSFVALAITGAALVFGGAPGVPIANPTGEYNLQVGDNTLFSSNIKLHQFGFTPSTDPFFLPFPIYMPPAATMTGWGVSTLGVDIRVILVVHGFIIHKYLPVRASY